MHQEAAGMEVLDAHKMEIKSLAREGAQQRE
jgi:hypothetical protein